MEPSILISTKKVLLIGPDDDTFDLDVSMYINGGFSTLNDLGVGPTEGFSVEDDTQIWADFLSGDGTESQLNSVKNFIFLNTKMLFDPPQSGIVMGAMQKQLDELVFRISVRHESVAHPYVPPDDDENVDDDD